MVEISGNINKICPVAIDEETRLDGTIVYPPSDFQYNYTFVNVVKEKIHMENFIPEMQTHLLQNIKTDRELAPFRKNNITLHYNYQDRKGKDIYKFTFTPEDYKD